MGVMKQQQGMKKEQLTEQSIQQRLNHFFASYKYKADGLYVFSWESDKLIWTKSGYIYEFEIKISRSDFKNDFKHKKEKHIVLASTIARDKAKEIQMSLFEQKEQENMHWSREMLERRYGDIDAMVNGKRMPNYFYYAVPTGMLEPDEVPPYAGLIYIDSEYRYVKQSYRIVKEAPQLHKTKYTDAELNLGEKFYYNMQTWKQHWRDQVNYSLMYRQRLQDELKRKGIDKSYLEMADALKKAECRAEFAEHNVSTYKQINYNLEDGANYHRIESRMFIDAIKELNPDFDYREFRKEVDKEYLERYPKKK